jgi:hypothetical protein
MVQGNLAKVLKLAFVTFFIGGLVFVMRPVRARMLDRVHPAVTLPVGSRGGLESG